VAHPQIAVFARLADGQAAPIRSIEGQTTLLSRTMHGIAYDDVADRIIVPAQFSQAILSFRGEAMGEERPVRVIQGPHTEIRRADRVAVDPIRKEIFVGDGGQVLVFPADANGDVAPIRAIRGPDTLLSEGGGGGVPAIAVDPVTRTLVVAARGLLIFDSTANGNVKPLRVITGDRAGQGRLAAAYNGLIFAGAGGQTVGVWSVNDSGNAPARFKIGQGVLKEMRGLAVDAKNKSVIITDKELNAVMTWSVPEVFAQATGTRTN
jgi:DNA-binding beta-propeller fold protein YncE